MKPTMTIIGYLYSLRKTWLRHHEECICDTDVLIREVLDQVPVDKFLAIEPTTYNPNGASFLYRTSEDWDEICGPSAERTALNAAAEAYMNQAAELMALVATKERLSSE